MKKTFACLATPHGEGGIHVILLAGEGSRSVVESVFEPASGKSLALDASLRLGKIVSGGEIVDEVLLASPGGTGGVFEINGHGGFAASEAIMRRLQECGVQKTRWSRFSLRFPAAGSSRCRWRARILLAFAENETLAKILANQAMGALDAALAHLTRLIGDAASGVPFAMEAGIAACDALLADAALGAALACPPEAVILGPRNAGKSTLFNRLAGRERVIVDDSPGTTRDLVRETVGIQAVPVVLSDSAGLASRPGGPAEAAGIAASRRCSLSADLRIFLFDGSRRPCAEDIAEFKALPSPTIAAAGKSDLAPGPCPVETISRETGIDPIVFSAVTGEGVDGLKSGILHALSITPPSALAPGAPLLIGGRCERLVRQARDFFAGSGSTPAPLIAAALALRTVTYPP